MNKLFCYLAFDDDLERVVDDMKDNISTNLSTLHKTAIVLFRWCIEGCPENLIHQKFPGGCPENRILQIFLQVTSDESGFQDILLYST